METFLTKAETNTSAVLDLLNISILFHLCEDIKSIVVRGHPVSKALWKDGVWKRAWTLQEDYGRLLGCGRLYLEASM